MKKRYSIVYKLLEESWGSEHGVNDFGCRRHSAGFIDGDGNFMGLGAPDGETHDDFLMNRDLDAPPPDWITCHNAQQLTIDLDKVTHEQIDALIEFWFFCSKWQRWIREPDNPETSSLILFPKGDSGYDELTIPEFLGMYGTRQHINTFFEKLLG